MHFLAGSADAEALKWTMDEKRRLMAEIDAVKSHLRELHHNPPPDLSVIAEKSACMRTDQLEESKMPLQLQGQHMVRMLFHRVCANCNDFSTLINFSI